MISFHECYSKYAAHIHRFAFWLCGNEDDARDLTSETFVRLWTQSGNIHGDSLKSYLFTITHRLYLQGLRHRNREGDMPQDLAHPGPCLEETLANQAQLKKVLKAMQTLPPDDRAALIMRSREGLSYKEIAACLGLTPAAARVRVHRARVKLLDLNRNE